MSGKRVVPKWAKKTFLNNGQGGVESFIAVNSEPKPKLNRNRRNIKELKENSAVKIDISNVASKLKKITKVTKPI